MSKDDLVFINLAIPVDMLTSVYALLGGAAPITLTKEIPNALTSAKPATAEAGAATPNATAADAGTSGDASTSTTATTAASPSSEGERDAAGTLFDPARHTGTKVKSGLWRMKAGLSRGPGEGEDAIPAVGNGSATGATSSDGDPPPPPPEEEDEFASFAADVPVARELTDADLSSACNECAKALGSPAKVKEIIAKYTPEGEQQHSRHVPKDQREAFLAEIEAAGGFKYASGL